MTRWDVEGMVNQKVGGELLVCQRVGCDML